MNTPASSSSSADASACILRIQQLHFAYSGQPPVVDGWSAAIGPGVTLLHGDSGSGKTTLLRIMAGVLPGFDGTLQLAGARLPGDAEAYRRQLFFLDPYADVFGSYDALTGHECAAALRAGAPAFDAARWQVLVDGFALAPQLDKKMYMLSTGSKRKVWLAAALAAPRALTLLDEPTGGLDAGSIRCLWKTLAELADHGQCAVIVASGEPLGEAVPLAGTVTLPLG